MGNCGLKIKPADGTCSTTNSPFFKEQTFSISQFSINQLKKRNMDKKSIWKLVIQTLVTILTAIGTTLGVTSCL
jgi:hypothetical protein